MFDHSPQLQILLPKPPAGGAAVRPPTRAPATCCCRYNDSNGESGFDPGEALAGALTAWRSLLTLHHLRLTLQAVSHPAFNPGATHPSLSPRLWPCTHGSVIVLLRLLHCDYVVCLQLLDFVIVTLLCHFRNHYYLLTFALPSFIPCTSCVTHGCGLTSPGI